MNSALTCDEVYAPPNWPVQKGIEKTIATEAYRQGFDGRNSNY